MKARLNAKIWLYPSPALYLRQSLYLVLLMSMVLVLSSSAHVRYVNQRRFLRGVTYGSVELSDTKEGQTFEYAQLQAARTGEDQRILLDEYTCGIFSILPGQVDYEQTDFTAANLDGCRPEDLQEQEAILSYDTARALRVSEGDRICLFPMESGDICELTVRGVMRTHYTYGSIGTAGTILARLAEGTLHELSGGAVYLSYHEEEGQTISRREQLEECSLRHILTTEESMPGCLFPVMALLLLGLVISREYRGMAGRGLAGTAALSVLGEPPGLPLISLDILEMAAVIASSVIAAVLYGHVFMDRMMGEYTGPLLNTVYALALCLLSVPVIAVSSGRERRRITSGIMKVLSSY